MASADDKSPTEASDFMIPQNDQETTEGGLSIRDLLAVLEPVIDWYQSDEGDPRAPLDILRDMVSDLQSDRKAALVASSAATDALALCHQIERCGCSEQLTKSSIMASDLRSKLASANEPDGGFEITTMEQTEQKPIAEWEGRPHGSDDWEDIWPEHDGQMSYGPDIVYVEIRRKGADALT